MTQDEILDRIDELPAAVKDHLFSDAVGEGNIEIVRRNGLSPAQKAPLYGLIDEVIVRAVPLDSLVSEIRKRFPEFDDAAARTLARDIAGHRLLPLDKWLGDIGGYIRLLGGDPNIYPAGRVKIEQRTPADAAKEIVETLAPFEIFAPRLNGRLTDILTSFFSGIRTEAQVADALQRAEKIGGLGLNATGAATVMEEAREEARSVWITDENIIGPPPVIPAKAGTQGVPPSQTSAFVTIAPEDEQEIARLKDGVAVAALGTPSETPRKIEVSVDELYQQSGIVPPTEELQKRLKTVIGNRLRDVRDQMETLETLVQPKELGGMGLSQDDARKLLTIIEQKLKQVHDAHSADVTAKKAEWVQSEINQKAGKEQSEKIKEEDSLSRLYQDVIAKSPKAAARAAQSTSLPIMAGGAELPVPKPPPALVGTVEEEVPANLPFLEPIPAASPVISRPPMPTTAATIVRPMPGAAAPIAARPRIEDIRPVAPRLTGPVEELRATTLTDFRRLSKDPKEAVMKIKDKVDLLADQAFEKRTEGIRAWMESEVYRTYLEMMREALEGKPMPQVIADRQAGKLSHLTQPEVQAVADLSRNLRY